MAKKSIKEWKAPRLMYSVLAPYMDDHGKTMETITEEEMVSEVVWYLDKVSAYDSLEDYYGYGDRGAEGVADHRKLKRWATRAVERLEEDGRRFERY